MRARLVLLAVALLAARGVAGVLIVDSSGAGDFTNVASAIAAAAEGDTLLVQSNTFDASISIDGKSVTIVGDVSGALPTLNTIQGVTVANLAPGQQVVLRNLSLRAEPPFGAPALQLKDDQGGVWIEGCLVEGAEGSSSGIQPCFADETPGGPAARVQSCAAVTISGCTLLGGEGSAAYSSEPFHVFGWATDGGAGLRVESSMVAVFESSITGGGGGAGHTCAEVADGGLGVGAADASLLLSGCTVTGGVPGAGPPAGAPGDGVHGDVTSSFELLDTSVASAPGGVDFAIAPGTLTTYAGLAPLFSVTSPVRESQGGTLTLQGAQGDLVGFFWSFTEGLLPMPGHKSWFLLDAPFLAGPFLVGVITDPAGHWDLPFVAPGLMVGQEAQTFLLQAWFKSSGAGATLSSGTAFTLVSASL
jgi:hypothetical protein